MKILIFWFSDFWTLKYSRVAKQLLKITGCQKMVKSKFKHIIWTKYFLKVSYNKKKKKQKRISNSSKNVPMKSQIIPHCNHNIVFWAKMLINK